MNPNNQIEELVWIVSNSQRVFLEPLMGAALQVAPPWLRTLSVRYDPNLEDIAKVRVLPEYRTAHMQVGDAAFSDSPQETPITILHELMHTHVAALSNAFTALLEATTEPDTPLRAWAERVWHDAEEGCVTDLSRKIAPLLFGGER